MDIFYQMDTERGLEPFSLKIKKKDVGIPIIKMYARSIQKDVEMLLENLINQEGADEHYYFKKNILEGIIKMSKGYLLTEYEILNAYLQIGYIQASNYNCPMGDFGFVSAESESNGANVTTYRVEISQILIFALIRRRLNAEGTIGTFINTEDCQELINRRVGNKRNASFIRERNIDSEEKYATEIGFVEARASVINDEVSERLGWFFESIKI